MRPSPWIVTALITAATTAATAAPAGDDSPTLADRTSWLPARVTEVTTAVEHVPYVDEALHVDARHSFGWIEPFIGASFEIGGKTWPWPPQVDELRGGVRVPLTGWGALRLMGRRRAAPYDVTVTSLDAALEAQVPLWLHQAALRATVGGGFRRGSGELYEGSPIALRRYANNDPYAFASVAAVLQSTSSVALELGARVDVGPLYVSPIDRLPNYRQLSPYGTLLFGFDRVDLFARVSFNDITAEVDTAIAVGAAARF